MAAGQGAPLSVDAFVEAGGSFIRNAEIGYACPQVCTPSGCPPCPQPGTVPNAGRLFAGARFRMDHDAIEGSYSYSPNQAGGYNHLDLFSFNYVRYLWLRMRVQPFATIGLGANRISGPSPTPTSHNFAWNYGGGADVVLRRHLALRLELRDFVGGQPGGFGTIHNLAPSAGIVLKFR